MENFYEKIIRNNRSWVNDRLNEDPEFFTKLAKGQKPPLLWIGCADSRVPANEITGTLPGEVFVHRNIANMVVHTDMNMLSVLDYAVNVLEVEHVIVCGHHGCGGVKAAMGNDQFGLIDNWLRHLKDVYRLHEKELEAIENEDDRLARFVELNVIEQVIDLSGSSIIQLAWEKKRGPEIHGWVYDISNGLVQDLDVSMQYNEKVKHIINLDKVETTS